MNDPIDRRPLDGLRVLDFTRVLAGPFCTALLADLGAEVVKVEPPHGDEYRHVGPFRERESALFHLMNRNKSSVVLDLKSADGRAVATALAASADVVVENFKPGVAARLGIGYEQLREENPDLVYASISGFGQQGPLAERPAFDLIAQAMSGLMDVTGEPDGAPTKVGESFGDLSAGLYAAGAVLVALYRRERSGEGIHIDVAMFDSLFSLLPTAVAQWLFTGEPPRRVGNRHPLSTPFGAFATSDGHLVIAVLNERQFAALANVIGRPELAGDPRFASDSIRTRNEPELTAIIEGWLAERATADAVATLTAAGVPASPIWTVTESIESTQVAARGLLPEQDHPRLGAIRTLEQPVHFAGMARGTQRPAPGLGADTRAVLARLPGYDDERIAELAARGAIHLGETQ